MIKGSLSHHLRVLYTLSHGALTNNYKFSYDPGWKEDFTERIPTGSGYAYSYDRVVLKYPVTLLKDIPEEGLELVNEAVVTENWKSGYQTSHRVKDSVILYDQSYPQGEFDKHRENWQSSSTLKINGGQETILDDEKEISMPWEVIYEGNSTDSPITWDEDTQTYQRAERTIVITDGISGDLQYSSGLADAKYVWEPSTGNIDLSDNDYYFSYVNIHLKEYDARQVDGAWTGAYIHSNENDYEPIEIYVRKKGSDTFTYFKTVSALQTGSNITLPTDTVGVELRHDSKFYSTELYATLQMYLKPTQKVQALIQEDVAAGTTSLIKNRAVCEIYNTEEGNRFFYATDYTGGQNTAQKEIYELNISNTYQKTMKYTSEQGNTIWDVERGTQDNPVYIVGWNYNTSSRKKQVKTGIFYDLLPKGTTVDESTIFAIPFTDNASTINTNKADAYNSYKNSASKLNPGCYNVDFVSNWEGSGRTMMVINFTIPDDVTATGLEVFYLLHNTYENVIETGTTVENDVAFVNTTATRVVPYSRSYGLSVIDESQYFESLNTEYEKFISFAEASTNYIPVDAFSWGFDKTVKTRTEYQSEEITIPNNEYTYKLSYSQSDYATSSDITFFDILEYGADTDDGFKTSEWHGVLENIDVSSASSKLTDGSETVHCAPVIYYSTKDRSTFVGSDYNVSNTSTWSTTKPDDVSSITAIAVDCSKNEDGTDFVMKGRQVLEICITMRAPKEAEHVGKTAYNEGIVYSKKDDDETATSEHSDSKVTLQDDEPEIHKTSDPESGTEEDPTIMYRDDDLVYTLSVKNTSEDFTQHDIIVEDVIPDGLLVDSSNIKVHFGNTENAIKISESPRVSLQKTGQKLTFTIHSLLEQETVYLVIPTITNIREGDIVNTSKITSVNGVEKELTSETTYHRIVPPSIVIQKLGLEEEPLKGAVLQLLNSDGELVKQWTSTEKREYIEVDAGTYTLHEVSAPAGYLVAKDIEITIDRIGNMTVGGQSVEVVSMTDDWTKVSVSKTDITGSQEIAGATLAVYKKSDVTNGVPKEGATAIDTWTSVKDQNHVINGILTAGETYVLIETQAPDGFEIAEAVEFTVKTDGTIQTVTMKDQYSKKTVVISKEDINGNEIAGATLTITGRETGSTVDITPIKWTSEKGKTHTVTLRPGAYVLHEEAAPEGYEIATDISFTVGIDGTIVVDETNVDQITMTDTYSEHDVVISKEDINGNEIAGATLTISGRETGASSDIEKIQWVSEAGKTKTVKLKPGSYTLHENAAPNGYKIASDINFTVDVNGVVKVNNQVVDEVVMVDARSEHNVTISKEDINGKEIAGATLTINGREDGVTSDIAEIKWTSVADSAKTVSLNPGTYTLHEEAAPNGYKIASDISFNVSEDGTVTVNNKEVNEVTMTDAYEEHSLTVTKTVKGNMGDKTKEFSFKLKLTKGSLADLPSKIAYKKGTTSGYAVLNSNGEYEFKLAHGESIIFTGLTYDTSYTVSELDGASNGYEVSSTGESGKITTKDVVAAFTNTKNQGVVTDAYTNSRIAILVAVLSIVCFFILFVQMKKKRIG